MPDVGLRRPRQRLHGGAIGCEVRLEDAERGVSGARRDAPRSEREHAARVAERVHGKRVHLARREERRRLRAAVLTADALPPKLHVLVDRVGKANVLVVADLPEASGEGHVADYLMVAMRRRVKGSVRNQARQQIDNVVGFANFKSLARGGHRRSTRIHDLPTATALSLALYLLDTTMLCCALCAAAAA